MRNTSIAARAIVLALGASICALAVIGCGSESPSYYDDTPSRGSTGKNQGTGETKSGDTNGGGTTTATDPNADPDNGLTPVPQPTAPDPKKPPTPVATAKPIWVFNAYCGGSLGACEATGGDCATGNGGVAGTECTNLGERCLGPAKAAGVRKKFVCIPRGREVWAFNGYCGGDPNATCTPTGDKPACDALTAPGSDCPAAGAKCVRGSKAFVCLPKAGNAWVANAHCGDEFTGENSCADVAQPLCTQTAPGGTACDGNVPRCVTATSATAAGKVFACLPR